MDWRHLGHGLGFELDDCSLSLPVELPQVTAIELMVIQRGRTRSYKQLRMAKTLIVEREF